jgi:tRNA pseudouridine38-40 synthase
VTGRTFRLTVAWDGTGFHGWQRQPGVRTVQGVLEEALAGVLETERVATAGAGRTDAGVHARGQVASFTAATRLPARAFPSLVNRRLPADVRLLDAAEAPEGFHARHSARARRYTYRLLETPDLLRERHAWCPGTLPALGALVASAEPLEGRHDCSAFQAAGCASTDPVCRIHRARWSTEPDGFVFDVVADHFLYHMVRNLVGTSLAAARTPDPAGAMRAVLDSRDRSRAGATAPPQGLTLEHVYYEGEPVP